MYKISQLLITPNENERSTTAVYIAEPTPLEEKNFGTIFSIIDIDSKDTANEEVIKLINEELTNNYYRSVDLQIDVAIENTLHFLNRKLQKVVSELGEEWAKKFNAVIGVIKDKELHFSQTGSINILLAQKNQIIKLSENAKFQTVNPIKILANLSSGQLTASSAIIFCTESILDYLSQEKIKKILKENEPPEAARYLEEVLLENGNATNFSAIIMKLTDETKSAINESAAVTNLEKINKINLNPTEQPADHSMTHLVNQESQTNELLSPSLWPGIKKNIKQFTEKISPVKIKQPELKTPLNLKTNESQFIIILKKTAAILKNLLLRALSGLIKLLRGISGLFKQKKTYSSSLNSLPNKATGVIAKTVKWFKGLSTPRKAFIVLFIVIIFIFSQSIIRQGKKQEAYQEEKQYETNLATASNKLGEADSKIIMNDFTSARNLVKEASDLLNNIPKDSKTWEDKGADPASKLQSLSDKVNLVQRISEPKSLTNLNSLDANLAVSKINLISKTIFAFSANNNSVYSYNIDKNEAKAIINENDSEKKFAAISKDSAATILTVLENQKFMQFNPVLEKLSKIDISFDNKDTNIVDLDYFSSRLYTLDSKNNQIFKNSRTGDNYGNSESWLNDENVDLGDAKSFSVDGSMYVLKDGGKVIKLFSGKLENDWKLDEVSPSLAGATKIYTDENTTNIYILNPQQKQLAVFEKNGKLSKQYVSDTWGDLKDMYVDEANKKAYLLNGTELFEIDL